METEPLGSACVNYFVLKLDSTMDKYLITFRLKSSVK